MKISLKNIIFRIRNKVRMDKNNFLEVANNSKVVACHISIKGKNNKVFIGENTKIRDSKIEISGENCSVSILNNCVIGHGCYFVAKESNVNIEIGNGCMLSRNVNVMASDGHAIFDDNHERVNHSNSVKIGDGVWLADNVTILKGVSIGEGSVVGINSTLSKSIPIHCVAVGNPAKVVRESVNWEY